MVDILWQCKSCGMHRANSFTATLQLGFHVVNLYMHDFAMPLDQGLENSQASQPNGTNRHHETQSELLPPAHIGALTTCLTSIHGIFDTFLRFAALDIRTLPVFHFARLARASVLLIRMYYSAITPESALGKVISSDDMKVEHYLGCLIKLLWAGAAEGKCHPARQLSILLVLLQSNFERSREGKTGLADETLARIDARPIDTERYSSRQEYRKMQLEGDNFPLRASPTTDQPPPPPPLQRASSSAHSTTIGDRALHLLSEVAMGNSVPNGHHSLQPHNEADGAFYGYNAHADPPPYSTPHQMAATNPYATESYYQASLAGLDVTYHPDLHGLHAGLEQAISMTLGESDLSIMDDDGFYHIMQAAPGMFGELG